MYEERVTGKTDTTNINNIGIIGYRIVSFNRGIKSEFNKTLRSGQARFKYFPEASSKDFLHYIDPNLVEQNLEAAIIQIGINDILYDSTSREINLLFWNINEIEKKCKNYEIEYVFISSMTFNTRIPYKLLNERNEMIEKVYLENSYHNYSQVDPNSAQKYLLLEINTITEETIKMKYTFQGSCLFDDWYI